MRTQRQQELAGLGLGLVGVIIFGVTLPMTSLAVRELSPWFVTAGRAAVAGLLALLLLAALRRPLPPRSAWAALFWTALCVVGAFPALVGLAMQTVPASHGGVVLAILPLSTAIAATIVAGERPSPGFWLMGVLGSALVVVFAIRHNGLSGSAGLQPGDLLLMLAIVSTGLGYALSGHLSRSMPGWEVISWALVLSLPITAPVALLLWPADAGSLSAKTWGAFAYLALMSQYLGFFAWNAGLALGGVARVGQVQLLQTFVTLIVAAVLLGETLDVETIGFALAVVAIVIGGRRFRAA